MRNELERRRHWESGYLEKNQGDSPPCPFHRYLSYFDGGQVLEIGPGEGRQYRLLKSRVKSYSIADIVPVVTTHPLFSECEHKILLTDLLRQDTPSPFDVIHFWYVLHHVPKVELTSFFHFVWRNLKAEGVVMFNTPYLDFDKGAYEDNGVLTTPYTIHEIFLLLEPAFRCLIVDGTEWGKSNGYIYIGRKR